ncbi:MAG: serine acetyltransferase [Prevotella sp.]|nr:serine acetyltransferase [Prevotella sp.]
MNKRKIRDVLRLLSALIFSPLYIPHFIAYLLSGYGGGKPLIDSDLKKMIYQTGFTDLPLWLVLLQLLHNNRYYRNIFYHRVGPVWETLLAWYRPGNKYFTISKTTKIGVGIWIAHPYATIINADSIGSNFSCIHCTTIGATKKGRPVIGNNVALGANVTIIGDVHVGNNVTIGAGSVVVKDLPDNCIAAGNPAKVIKIIGNS